jgi:hypothetical protein
MFWYRGSSRQRKAVLSALSAVGETGMTLLALGVAVNLPEGRLHTILETLVRSGQVRRRGAPPSGIPGPRNAQYHLASGRHSAVPGIPARRTPTSPGEPDPAKDRSTRRITASRRGTVPPAGLRSGRAHGI